MKSGDMKKGVRGRCFLRGLSLVFLCLMAIASAGAQTVNAPPVRKGYATAELDQMLAPIALYSDGLLVQVLMASTYPGEVSEAGRWLSANSSLKGDAAVEAAADFDWNISVKSLLAFPDVLSTMSSNMGWTVKLGNAFNNQREEVMERIQYLRQKAKAAGNLRSDERMNVVAAGNTIAIEPVSQQVVYVPYYNPAVVYGTWWWPGYAPYYWSPWRGYAYFPGYYSSSFMWGSGVWFSYTRFYGRVDWHRRHVHWNPPPLPPVPRPVKPGGMPHPGGAVPVKPVIRPVPGGPNAVRPGNRPDGAPHVRPGAGRPDYNRPSSAVTGRPGQPAPGYNHPGPARAPQGEPARGRPEPHPDRGASLHQPMPNPVSRTETRQASRPIPDNRALEARPAGSNRHAPPSPSMSRPSDKMRDTHFIAQNASRSSEPPSARVSDRAGSPSSDGVASHGDGHDDRGGRGGGSRR